jgi:hypothetical protein
MEERTSMGWWTDDRELFLRYLAGELGEEETGRFEEQLLFDDEFFDRMEEAQNDLLDAYAAGELGEAQRQRMEAVLRSNPAQKRRFRVARALQRMRPPTAAETGIGEKWLSRSFVWRALLAFACAAVAVMATIFFYVKTRSQPKTQFVTAGQKTLSPSAIRPGPQVTPPTQEASRPAHEPAFALLLGVSVERGIMSNRPVTLPHGLGILEVQILLPAKESAEHYTVQVVFPHASSVRTFPRLTPEEEFSEKLLRFELPAAGLPPGVYVFRVYREGAAGTPPAASYQAIIARG